MKDLMRALRWPFVAVVALAVALGGASVAAASQAPHGSKKGGAVASGHHHKRHHAKRGPRGPRGVPGPSGPAGPAGPAGPPGTGVPFSFALVSNSPTIPVFDSNGVRIEAGCPGGALELILRPDAGDHNIVEITTFDNSAAEFWTQSETNAEINQRFSLLLGASPVDDFNGLFAVRTFGGHMTTAQWWAMGSTYASQYDCVGGGTISPH